MGKVSISVDLDPFYFIFYGIGISSVSIFGIFGSICSIIVFSSMRWSSNNIFLLSLSLSDVLLLFGFLFSYGLPSLFGNYSDINSRIKFNISPYVYVYGTRTLRKAGHTASVYTTLLVTLERFLVVCYPFYARQWSTRKKAILLSISVLFFSLIFNTPRLFDIRIKEKHGSSGVNGTLVRRYTLHNELNSNGWYMTYYRGWGRAIVMHILPFVTLPILNYFIYKKVKTTNEIRESMTSYNQAEVSINKTLIAIVTVFLLSNSPYAFFSICRILGVFKIPPILEMAAHLLIASNSFFNFVIYVGVGSKFKRELLKIFGIVYSQSSIRDNIINRDTIRLKIPSYNNSCAI